MIDSHSHIYSAEFDADRNEAIVRAQAAGVTHIVMPNENLASLPRLQATHEAHPGYVSMTIGLHPEEVHDNYQEELHALHSLLMQDAKCYVAIGEIGIDLYWEQHMRDRQMEALDTQLHWCKEANIPFIMHCRNGMEESLAVLDNFGEPLPSGVFHSFTGTIENIEQLRKRGDFYFGVNGIVTFKKSDISTLLPIMGINRILLETDSPYLAPVPHRGKRNESANIPFIARCIARHLNLALEEVDEITSNNVHQLFAI